MTRADPTVRPVAQRWRERLPIVAGLFAMVLAVAACGTGDTGVDNAVPFTPGDTVGGVPATGQTSSGPAAPTSPADTSGSPTTSTTETAPPSTVVRTAVAPPGGVGAYAGLYLRPSESTSLLLDVHSQEGAAPRAATLDHITRVLGQVSGKPVNVATGSLPGGAQAWTADQIRALGDSNGPDQSRDRSVLRLFYLSGEFAESDTVLGVAVRSDVAAVFSDKVDGAAGLVGSPSAIEDAVSMHEVGHVLGLVDLVLATGREDPDNPGHSRSRDSVMYYAVESTLISSLLEGGPPREFDQADLDDLATIRNG